MPNTDHCTDGLSHEWSEYDPREGYICRKCNFSEAELASRKSGARAGRSVGDRQPTR